MNAHLLLPKKQEFIPIRTITIKPKTEVEKAVEPERIEWEGCPTKEGVSDAIQSCQTFINNTQKIVMAIQHDGDAEQRRSETRIAMWKDEARVWNIKNSARIDSCWFLLGATGYQVHPELPLALENLKRSGNWLEKAVEAANDGKFKVANDYIKAARKANKQAAKLVAGKVRPKSKYALVNLPRHLVRKTVAKTI